MPGRGRSMGSDATALREESPATISSDAATMMPEMNIVSGCVKTAATVSPPTKSEIATIAYQLWVDNGCPLGSEQEDWFRAEVILNSALVAKCEEASRRSSVSRCETRTESEMLVEFRWEGHWEVWEREWGGARWVWDLGHSALNFRTEQAGQTLRSNSQR